MALTQQASGGDAAGGQRVRPDSATQAKINDINAKRNAELRELLTSDEDKAAFDTNVASMTRGRRGGGR
jgi:hypothetical protein